MGTISPFINDNNKIQLEMVSLMTGSSNIENSNGTVQGLISNLVEINNTLAGNWEGTASEQFKILDTYHQTEMNLMCGVVQGMSMNSASFAKESEAVDLNALNNTNVATLWNK